MAIEVLENLANLATVATFVLEFRSDLPLVGLTGIINRIRGRLTPAQTEALERPGAEAIIGVLVIDPDLLDDLKRELAGCTEKYRKRLKGGSRSDRDAADHQAERCVCEILNRIRRRNKGVLPGDLADPWQSYKCVEDWDY